MHQRRYNIFPHLSITHCTYPQKDIYSLKYKVIPPLLLLFLAPFLHTNINTHSRVSKRNSPFFCITVLPIVTMISASCELVLEA